MALELTDCYGITLAGGLLILWLVENVGHRFRFIFNPLRPVLLGGASRGEAVWLGCLALANGLCVGVAVNGPEDVIERLNHIILINLIPVFSGAHMNAVASLCGIRHRHHHKLHSWLGMLVAVEVAICTVLIALKNGAPGRGIPGLLVSSCLGGIALTLALQERLFELFSWIHSVLATAMLVFLWLYLPPSAPQDRPRLYLLLSGGTFASAKALRLANVVYRSLTLKSGSMATTQDVGDAVELRVWPARTLNYQPGQYIYLSLMGLSWFPLLSTFQLHPFQIIWSYHDDEGKQVLVLLSQRRRGFTRRISNVPAGGRRALIEGPYGRSLAVDEYGTVLLVATGIGITGQLPYIKELLMPYRDCRAKTRRIVLLWELDAEAHRWWVRDWMDALLEADVDHILDLKLYIRGRYLSSNAAEGTIQKLGSHDRIELNYAAMRPAWTIRSELTKRRGKTLVSLCTDTETTQAVTEGIGEGLWDGDIHMEKLDFSPGRRLEKRRSFMAELF